MSAVISRRRREKEVVSVPPAKQQQLRTHWGPEAGLTSFLSFRFVSMTMVAHFCSQIILQKSFTVSCLGPERRGWSESDRAVPGAPGRSCWLLGLRMSAPSPPALRKGVMGPFTPCRDTGLE